MKEKIEKRRIRKKKSDKQNEKRIKGKRKELKHWK